MLKRSYAISDFSRDYFSYKGNAYGLANTLMQVPACAAVSTRVRVRRRIVGVAVLCFSPCCVSGFELRQPCSSHG